MHMYIHTYLYILINKYNYTWRIFRGRAQSHPRGSIPIAVGFTIWSWGFGVWGLGFGVWGLGFGVWGLGLRI